MIRILSSLMVASIVGCGAAGGGLGNPDSGEGSDAGDDATVRDAGGVDGTNGQDGMVEFDSGQDAGSNPDGGPTVTVADVQHSAFVGCIGEGCHGCFAVLPDAGCAWRDRPLDLYGSSDQVVQSLVNVMSISSPTKVRVKPFDPDNSFIVQKLEGHLGPNEGSRMPLGRNPIPQTSIDVLRAWITQGAHAN
jgi:hypothetical protein